MLVDLDSDELVSIKRNFLPGDLQPLLESCGVDKSVIVQTQHNLEENRWALKLAQENAELAQSKEVQRKSYDNLIKTGESMRNSGQYQEALDQLQLAQNNARQIGKEQARAKLAENWEKIFSLIQSGDSLVNQGEDRWQEALNNYKRSEFRFSSVFAYFPRLGFGFEKPIFSPQKPRFSGLS